MRGLVQEEACACVFQLLTCSLLICNWVAGLLSVQGVNSDGVLSVGNQAIQLQFRHVT